MTISADVSGLSIDEAPLPARLDSPEGQDFTEMVELRNTIEREILGTDDAAPTARELLATFRDPYAPKRLFLARLNGGVVGRGVYEWQPEENAPAAFIEVQVASTMRRHGIGTAILTVLERIAAENGLTVIQSWSSHALPASSEVLVPPTGFGAVDRDSAAVRFARAHGYSLEQVDRISRVELPMSADLLTERRRDAEPHAVDYEVVQWAGRCPDRWLTDMARLHQRMSTDAPAAAIEFAEELWDDDRMRNLNDMNEAGGRLNLTSAALHVPSQRLVGYTDIAVPEQEGRPAVQEDTLVLKEHRGHRLGTLLKLANLEQVMRVSPTTPRITTFNAEENRPMLDVNEAVGFEAIGCEAAWKKAVGS
ncbi:GNAT superfamily N-acetyltransferase [Okibacterium sp. HSC-33S16]|uniref:GNAT family N-acetyltransferase n=1 Tax=Okibacterium sp. HSC-33S16 TaxID=2910965 RepID=UPI00209C89F1|nr:GNAT family N-acetyltransferase [Okibacterium sp. HSC-33S16]MCP2030548.1 GNAT superfamily N-acetyltransferase [Okibacterium sp. HSC-33S16]